VNIEDKIDRMDFQESWLQHPLTIHKRRELEKRRRAALAGLVASASVSSDPVVRGALMKFRELEDLVLDLGGVRYADEVK
jgi:hypothetical protein